MARRISIAPILLTIICCLSTLDAQQSTSALGVDELFTLARKEAFAGKRVEARILLRRILIQSPNYVDVRVLLGRTLAWDGKYDSARIELRRALKSDPSNDDAYRALIDTENWSEKYQAAVAAADEALRSHPNDEEIFVKKAIALRNLGRDYEALTRTCRGHQSFKYGDPRSSGADPLEINELLCQHQLYRGQVFGHLRSDASCVSSA